MTRRSSLRAAAREIYGALAAAPAAPAGPAQIGAGEPSGPSAQNLTEQVRALYETSAVPVREIAQLAGVSERTIYKYVRRHGWIRRYRVTPRGAAAAAANRGRRLRPSPDFAPDLTPVRGAGGRFIRREDKDKPFAHGLKATDAEARARAVAACRQAELLARAAQAQALTAQRFDARLRAIAEVNRACAELAQYRHTRARQARDEQACDRPAPDGDLVERALSRALELATQRWEALLAPEQQSARRNATEQDADT
jgi:hypothetical protein